MSDTSIASNQYHPNVIEPSVERDGAFGQILVTDALEQLLSFVERQVRQLLKPIGIVDELYTAINKATA